MLLRRRGDTFENVIREHLGGQLFARGGVVDKLFKVESHFGGPFYKPELDPRTIESVLNLGRELSPLERDERIKMRVQQHIEASAAREDLMLFVMTHGGASLLLRRLRSFGDTI